MAAGGKRFITHSIDRDAYEVMRREMFYEAEWKELCEQHDIDPTKENFFVSTVEVITKGVTGTPSMWLTTLIAAYALAHQPLEPLLAELHPGPASVEKRLLIEKKVEELKKVAGHLAARVRGGTVGRSAPIEEVSDREHLLAWKIHELEREGVSSKEELFERLKRLAGQLMVDLTPDDVAWLRSLGLKPPE